MAVGLNQSHVIAYASFPRSWFKRGTADDVTGSPAIYAAECVQGGDSK